ncbi:MAG TPA: glycosyltransferase family 1 protein [Solirubrobacteraceae bacterium]|nr:glycosyltransferase family 1 protein [Solirubrobacteraceae bacterium]
MRVAFDSRAKGDARGIGRYVRCMLEALTETAVAGDSLSETHHARGSDVFHSPWLDGAQLRCPCASVVTIHDLVNLKARAEYLRTGMRFRLRYLAVQRAERVIVPTEVVAVDAQECLDIDRGRIEVIPEAAAPAMYPRGEDEVAAVRERYGLPERYLLWVGSMLHPERRKRVAELAAAPRSLPLVLAGPARQWAHELPDVTLTGQVSDDELAALYAGAHALVFPSDEEGFGLPAVEALACGTPVVACDAPALREVLGERATFVARGDMAGLLEAAAAAVRPAPAPPRWTWSDAARATWGVYAAAVAAHKQPASTRRVPRLPRGVF